MKDKIVLEEHLTTEFNNGLWDASGEAARNGKAYMEDVDARLLDADRRIDEMDRSGIDIAILSLTSPGAQAILDPLKAVDFAKRTNDEIAEHFTSRHPQRLQAFATVALQSPRAAADELERAVKDLGMKGALINGYTNIGNADTAQYLDEPPVWEFWERVAALDVPVYLHPREPLPSQQRIYAGYASLVGSAWGFAHETATHAIRLMLSGLFDRYPRLTVILGHLGEGLPLMLPRLEHRLAMQRNGTGLGNALRPVSEYFSDNFYITTSGHFHTKGLLNTISEIGVDRVLFSADYPYESMETASEWFDNALVSENDRTKIGRTNAVRLFGL
ncbi:amidohydrolase family protein [Burkholderia semiarida]|uniref:amidohydrolase family protein n=1 Tax=Burkholderia TaxID=32008 RepID=UPI001CF46E18|nr:MULTISPECIES: amidohydrolase family protein [Burkholderia]MCA8037206.1 amidohydrolase family protein [Burkholderia arboris]MDN7702618.1 amidohydrolase family protein [Burkholderia sp. AU44665]